MIGANVVAKSPGDGYTVLVTSVLFTVTPLQQSGLSRELDAASAVLDGSNRATPMERVYEKAGLSAKSGTQHVERSLSDNMRSAASGRMQNVDVAQAEPHERG